MMKKMTIILLLLAICGLHCTKAGKGGKAKILVHFYDKDKKVVVNAYIYIKYNATSWPGPSFTSYDDSKATDYSGKIELPDMCRGDYFFYGIKSDTIFGGAFYSVKNRIGENEVVIHQGSGLN